MLASPAYYLGRETGNDVVGGHVLLMRKARAYGHAGLRTSFNLDFTRRHALKSSCWAAAATKVQLL